MKKRLTVNSIAKNNLKARKKQYTLLILGIILAMVFSSSVLFLFSCMQTSIQEKAKNTYGAQDEIYINMPDEMIKQAEEQGVFDEYAFAHVIGFAYTDEYDTNTGASIAYMDDKAKELSYISFIDGGYPQAENEIAFEKAALTKLGIQAEIGDSITLNVLVQNGEEQLENAVEKTYTLVGIAANKKSNMSVSDSPLGYTIPSAFVYDGAQIEAGGKELPICYYTITSWDACNDFIDRTDSWDFQKWISYGRTTYMNERYEITESLGFVIVFAIVLLIASSMGIINAFSSNLKERKKQIGMLRTVGATKRQIITIFGREAFIISLICAPISLVLSYFLVKLIISFMGSGFYFIPKWWVLIACGAFGVLCVMAASLIPLISASKISPIQSVRNVEYTRKMKNRHIKSQKSFVTSALLAKRNISFSRLSYTAVNIILVISILISCLCFSYVDFVKDDYASSMKYDYILERSGSSADSNYCINSKSNNIGFTEKDVNTVLSIPYVNNVYAAKKCNALILTDELTDYMKAVSFHNMIFYDEQSGECYSDKYVEEHVDELIDKSYNRYFAEIEQHYGYSQKLFGTGIEAFNPEVIEKLAPYVTDGKINIDKLNSGEEIILYAPEKVAAFYQNTEDGGYTWGADTNSSIESSKGYTIEAENTVKAGDKITISVLTCDSVPYSDTMPENCERNDREVTVGAVISGYPDDFYYEINFGIYNDMKLVTTVGGMNFFIQDKKCENINVLLKADCTEEIEAEMNETLSELASTIEYGMLRSNFANAQEQKSFLNSLTFSILAIVILFLSISASIINNSLSSRIRESRREIGTLRAVGATEKELTLSYIRQLLSVFGTSYIAGFGGFTAIYFITLAVSTAMKDEMTFTYCIWQTLIACVILFAVCSINLWLKIRKEMKNSIIDNIREL